MNNIKENNLLICKFLGASKRGKDNTMWYFPYPFRYTMAEEERFEFHCSWDWLIPVLQKIYNEESMLMVEQNGVLSITPYINKCREFKRGLLNLNLIETYDGVISFIEWYNFNKSK